MSQAVPRWVRASGLLLAVILLTAWKQEAPDPFSCLHEWEEFCSKEDLGALEDMLFRLEEGERDPGLLFEWTDLVTQIVRMPEAQLQDAGTELLEYTCEVARAARDTTCLAWSSFELGLARIARGDYERAKLVLQQGLECRVDEFHAWFYLCLAEVHRELDRWGDAREYLDQAQACLRDGPQPALAQDFACQLSADRGQYYLRLGVVDQAEVCWRAARDRVLETSEPESRQRCEKLEVSLALGGDEYGQAFDAAAEFLKDRDLYPPESGVRAQLLISQGIAAYGRASQGEPGASQAQRALEQALECDGIQPRDRLRALATMASVALLEDDLSEAERILIRAERWRESLESRNGERVSADLCCYLDALRARWAIELPLPPEQLVQHRERLEDSLDERMNAWAKLPIRAGGAGFLHLDEQRDALAEWIEITVATAGREQGAVMAFEFLLRAQGLGSISRSLKAQDVPLPPLTVAEVRRWLGPDHGLMVCLPTTRGTHLFFLDRDQLTLISSRENSRGVLQSWRRTMIESIQDENLSSRATNSARQLADALFPGTIRDRLAEWSGVTLVGLDLLGWIPPGLLPMDPAKPLGTMLPLATLPSVPLGLLLRERAKDSSSMQERGLVMAAPDHARELLEQPGMPRPLRLTSHHHELLAGSVSKSGQVLTGPQATWENFCAANDGTLRFLHLFLHGVHRSDRERTAGLVFAPSSNHADGLVWCEDIEELTGVPEVTMLSACSTMRGPQRHGDDGVEHLGGAWFQAGASVVLQARLPLDSARTADVSAAITHRIVHEGMTPAEAVFATRQQWFTRRPRDPTPFIMQAVGDAHRSYFERPEMPVARAAIEPQAPKQVRSKQKMWWVVAGLLLLAAVAWTGVHRASR